MAYHTSLACRGVARLPIGLLAALCLAVPVLAAPGEGTDEKSDAAKVAKRMEKALGIAREAEGLRHFEKALAQYAELHARQLARLGPRPLADARETVAAQRTLARAIAAKRAKAEPGTIFRPEVQPLFRRLIAEQLRGPDALDARRTLLESDLDEGVSVPVVVRVNAEYPSGAPRSTVPPSMLLTLPPLPACLHYRFVERDLVLVDCVAQLIVDFLPDAAPDVADQPLP